MAVRLHAKFSTTNTTLPAGFSNAQIVEKDSWYVHNQLEPSDTWTVNHKLNKWPSVTVVDSAETVVIGDVQYISEDTVIITFQSAFSGKAFFN